MLAWKFRDLEQLGWTPNKRFKHQQEGSPCHTAITSMSCHNRTRLGYSLIHLSTEVTNSEINRCWIKVPTGKDIITKKIFSSALRSGWDCNSKTEVTCQVYLFNCKTCFLFVQVGGGVEQGVDLNDDICWKIWTHQERPIFRMFKKIQSSWIENAGAVFCSWTRIVI